MVALAAAIAMTFTLGEFLGSLGKTPGISTVATSDRSALVLFSLYTGVVVVSVFTTWYSTRSSSLRARRSRGLGARPLRGRARPRMDSDVLRLRMAIGTIYVMLAESADWATLLYPQQSPAQPISISLPGSA